MPITITREQRDAIRADLVADLTAIGDIDLALRHGEWAKARELRARFEQDMRLLDDIGWGEHRGDRRSGADPQVRVRVLRCPVERLGNPDQLAPLVIVGADAVRIGQQHRVLKPIARRSWRGHSRGVTAGRCMKRVREANMRRVSAV